VDNTSLSPAASNIFVAWDFRLPPHPAVPRVILNDLRERIVPKALLKVLKHFISAIRSLINSSSKPCRLEGQVAKWAFATVSHKPFDSLLDLLATFGTRNFQR
jgi:hypothetical protein